jgi:hypothetical protein
MSGLGVVALTAATAVKLGATIVSTSKETWTKAAIIRDPQGAEFTVSQFPPPTGDQRLGHVRSGNS